MYECKEADICLLAVEKPHEQTGPCQQEWALSKMFSAKQKHKGLTYCQTDKRTDRNTPHSPAVVLILCEMKHVHPLVCSKSDSLWAMPSWHSAVVLSHEIPWCKKPTKKPNSQASPLDPNQNLKSCQLTPEFKVDPGVNYANPWIHMIAQHAFWKPLEMPDVFFFLVTTIPQNNIKHVNGLGCRKVRN